MVSSYMLEKNPDNALTPTSQRERNAILNHVLGSELTDMPALVAVAFDTNQILQVETMVREKLKMAIMIRKSKNRLHNGNASIFNSFYYS